MSEFVTTKTDLKSFHSNASIKEKYLSRVRAHRAADEIVQGIYWDNGKGCAVGCTLHSANHRAYEHELGIPVQLAYIQDSLFERLSPDTAKPFPEQFLESIPVGVSLYPAYWKFMLFVLIDEEHGIISLTKNEDVQRVTRSIASLYQKAIDDTPITKDEFYRVRRAAIAALAARPALDALDARAALAALDLVWRDKLLECLAAS